MVLGPSDTIIPKFPTAITEFYCSQSWNLIALRSLVYDVLSEWILDVKQPLAPPELSVAAHATGNFIASRPLFSHCFGAKRYKYSEVAEFS